MDVSITELRANLSSWLTRANAGDEILVTDRGLPVARILGAATTPTIERLIADGVIAAPESSQRPRAATTERPRSRHPVSERVSEQRA